MLKSEDVMSQCPPNARNHLLWVIIQDFVSWAAAGAYFNSWTVVSTRFGKYEMKIWTISKVWSCHSITAKQRRALKRLTPDCAVRTHSKTVIQKGYACQTIIWRSRASVYVGKKWNNSAFSQGRESSSPDTYRRTRKVTAVGGWLGDGCFTSSIVYCDDSSCQI